MRLQGLDRRALLRGRQAGYRPRHRRQEAQPGKLPGAPGVAGNLSTASDCNDTGPLDLLIHE